MEFLNFHSLIIILPMLFLAGFVDSIGGGGGLISLPAFLIAGLPVHLALGTNKLQSCCGTTLTTFRFIKNGYVNFKLVAPALILAIIGSSLGSRTALYISEVALNRLLIVVLPIAAFLVLNKKLFNSKKDLKITKHTYIATILCALIVGFYDGLYGPGTGTFLIIGFCVFAHMNVRNANANAKLINFTTNITALFVFLLNGKVLFPLGLLGAVFNIAGNYIGSSMAMKDGEKITRPIIIFVLIILAIKIFFDIIN